MNRIWRKDVSANWLSHHGEILGKRFGSSVALIERPEKTRVTIEIACATEREAQALQDELGGSVLRLQRDWLQRFSGKTKKKPLRIGSRLLVFASPNEARACSKQRSGRHSITIPAETAFGTGEHATTAMCLRLLERSTRSSPIEWTMLDAGTGSGILAIAGSYFGAGRVLAVERDSLACKTAKRNARLNGCRGITVVRADILTYRFSGKFDIITANLFSHLLVNSIPIWKRHLALQGKLIFSGILRTQESETFQAFRQQHFTVSDTSHCGRWVAATVCRQ